MVITSQGACYGTGIGVGVGVIGGLGRKWEFPWKWALGSTNGPI